jgi:hypothetical protein
MLARLYEYTFPWSHAGKNTFTSPVILSLTTIYRGHPPNIGNPLNLAGRLAGTKFAVPTKFCGLQ